MSYLLYMMYLIKKYKIKRCTKTKISRQNRTAVIKIDDHTCSVLAKGTVLHTVVNCDAL